MVRLATGIVFVVVGLLWTRGDNAAGATGWKARWDKTLEAAKKEGQVTIYGGEEITHLEIIEAFTKSYPEIKVVTVSGHAEVIQRIVAERRAGKYLVDLFAYGPNAARTAYLAKYLDLLAPELILPEVTDASKWYGGKHHYADPEGKYIFIYEGTPSSPSLQYNTNKVDSRQITTMWDILKPKWVGNIGFFNYAKGDAIPTPVLMMYHDPDLGPKFLNKLFGEMKIIMSANRRQATDWLGQGKYALCIMCRDVEKAQKQGLPVATFGANDLKEGGQLGGGNSSVIIVLNQRPHPNAGAVFLNWYLSRQGQEVWQRVMNRKVNEPSNSMRVDISTDDVLPEARRLEGRKYPFVEFLDPKPVRKIYNNWIRQAQSAEK
jgi:ABC-type Fe3+ transport system substrate-binding protein